VPNYLDAGDKDMRQLALINILKDTAIIGFALHVAAGRITSISSGGAVDPCMKGNKT
jgi:hypothetical protein